MTEDCGLPFDINRFLADALVAWSEKGFEKIQEYKKNFLKAWGEQKFKKSFGFSADVETAKNIYKIGNDPSFRILENCVGDFHWALDFVKVGIHIGQLSDAGKRTEVKELVEDVRKHKGLRASNIVKLGSTGAIKGIIGYLESLRIGGYLIDSLIEEFERIIFEWEKITIFIDKRIEKEQAKNLIINKIEEKPLLFFVFSYGFEANNVAMCAIADLNNDKMIVPKGYLWNTYPRYDGVGTEIYMWSFTHS